MDNTGFDTLNWVTLAEIGQSGELSCIDGRHSNCIVGAPGGNMGEFILLLGAAESLTGRLFSRQQVRALLMRNSEVFGLFYMHTDVSAMRALQSYLEEIQCCKDLLAASTGGAAGMYRALTGLACTARHEEVLDLLVMPRFTGCWHLRLLLEDADRYGLRHGLVVAAIAAFFELLWEGNHGMHFVMLEGEHHEQCVLTIDSCEEADENTRVPYVCTEGARQNFVNHRVARHYFLKQGCGMLTDEMAKMGVAVEAARLYTIAQSLGDHQFEITLARLAADLPQLRLVVEELFADAVFPHLAP